MMESAEIEPKSTTIKVKIKKKKVQRNEEYNIMRRNIIISWLTCCCR